MTTLLLDLGNTRLKVGLWNAGQRQVRLLTAIEHADLAQLQTALHEALDALAQDAGTPSSIALGASVASQDRMASIAQTLTSAATPIETRWIWPQAEAFGVRNAYPDPLTLGADRWAGVLGLSQQHREPSRSAILANFGTATTVDTLSAENVFLGGLILPGVSMMQSSLERGTARLPLARGEVLAYPTDTHAAITTGIVAAQIGAISRQYQLSLERDGIEPLVCVSGGAWQALAQEWHRMLPDVKIIQAPNIVLEGLSLYAQEKEAKQ